MRTWCYPCLVAFGLLIPRPCLAQAAADDPRAEQEMQEDIEVLRRIVTETVQYVYQEADERVSRTCATCHRTIHAPLVGTMVMRGLAPSNNPGAPNIAWDAATLNRIHQTKPTDDTRVSGLANYVAGHGIVLQMEAPAPVVDRDVKAWVAADEAAPKRWELLLREMRGEPEKNPAIDRLIMAPEQRRVHRLILTEKLLEVLAENGRNLRRLTPDEHVTIAFTFRTPSKEQREAERATLLRHYFPDASSQAPAKSNVPGGMGAGAGGALNSDGGLVGNVGANRSASAVGGNLGAGQAGGAGPRSSGPTRGQLGPGPMPIAGDESPSVRTSAMAGDLLLRQERYAEAIAAYKKALGESRIDFADSKTPLPADAAELVRKLVQAEVGAKKFSEATILLQWLERSQASSSDETQALRRIYLDLTGLLPTPDDVKAYLADTHPNRRQRLLERLLGEMQEGEGPSRVPARMTISCTRKQLDEVASGKLSKLDFASKVTLKFYKAAPAGKDGVKRK